MTTLISTLFQMKRGTVFQVKSERADSEGSLEVLMAPQMAAKMPTERIRESWSFLERDIWRDQMTETGIAARAMSRKAE